MKEPTEAEIEAAYRRWLPTKSLSMQETVIVRHCARQHLLEMADKEAFHEHEKMALRHSVVSTVGGMVEGMPTQTINYLQRLRELVAKEKDLSAMRESRDEWSERHAQLQDLYDASMAEIRHHLDKCPEPKPIITDAACKQCDCWLQKDWTHCAYCGTARKPEFPKPTSDLSGLPDAADAPVLVHADNPSRWFISTAGAIRQGYHKNTHWMPQPPSPIPPEPTAEELEREAFEKVSGHALSSKLRDQELAIFRAGIAFAKRLDENKKDKP